MEPKWQRARVVWGARKGDLIWVSGHIHATYSASYADGSPHKSNDRTDYSRCLDANIIAVNGLLAAVSLQHIELLPEFADDVPLVSYDEWVGDRHNLGVSR